MFGIFSCLRAARAEKQRKAELASAANAYDAARARWHDAKTRGDTRSQAAALEAVAHWNERLMTLECATRRAGA
jgi:hypothetical protein